MTPTLSILMMVIGWALLLAVGVAQAVLAALTVREWRKVPEGLAIEKRYASVAAKCSLLERDLRLLEETVDTKLNRIATTSKRRKKELEEEEQREDAFPTDLEFPSRNAS